MTAFAVPLLPKLRGQFAEFLNKGSPVRLRIFFSSTCVGLRYGHLTTFSSFSRRHGFTCFASLVRSPSRLRFPTCVLHYKPTLPLGRAFPIRTLRLSFRVTASLPRSVVQEFSTCCPSSTPFGLDLGPRLTLGGRTFPRKPQTFDGGVSRTPLATYAGILSSVQSTTPSGMASARTHCSSTNTLRVFPSFGVRFEPR